MTKDQKAVQEKVTMDERHQGQSCGNCRHSMPSAIGGRVWCFVTDQQWAPADHCCRYQVRD